MPWRSFIQRLRHGSARDVVLVCSVIFFAIVIITGSLTDPITMRYTAICIGIPFGLIVGLHILWTFLEARRIWKQMRSR